MNKEEIETCIYEIQDELRAHKKQMDALEGDLILAVFLRQSQGLDCQ
jgi:hypothetical protein